jgi:hypothetical protein
VASLRLLLALRLDLLAREVELEEVVDPPSVALVVSFPPADLDELPDHLPPAWDAGEHRDNRSRDKPVSQFARAVRERVGVEPGRLKTSLAEFGVLTPSVV